MAKSGNLEFDALYKLCRSFFSELKDPRSQNASIRLADYFLSAMAIFQLKYPSLLALDKGRTKAENMNLLKVFGIRKTPSDTAMRETLDEIAPDDINPLFKAIFDRMRDNGRLKKHTVLGGYLLTALDGVEFFSSTKVHCDCCQVRKGRGDESPKHYAHSILAAVVVKPGLKTVLPMGCEPITRKDGSSKNDHELNAGKRLLARLREQHKGLKTIYAGDALYANGPIAREIIGAEQHFLLNVKPDSHATLFEHYNKQGATYKSHEVLQGKERWRIHWHNNLPLNGSAGDVRVNFMVLKVEDGKGNAKSFSWVTNLEIDKKNVTEMAACGRARWKIENETFNTLKNQGYNFEHNYGHGKKNLSNLLAAIMMMVFLIDQIQEMYNEIFTTILKATKTKKRLWDEFRAVFRFVELKSFDDWLNQLAKAHSVFVT